MKKNIKKIIAALIFVVLVIVVIVFFLQSGTRLTGNEREWITKNQNTIQNINVVNNVNLMGSSGVGMYYSFLEDFMNHYSVKLNYVTIGKDETPSYLAFQVGNTLPEHAFAFLEDHYVLVGKNDSVLFHKQDIKNTKIGVLTANLEYIQRYLNDLSGVEFVGYENDSFLLSALDNGDISYMIVPRQEYLDTILKKYNIAYHFSDIHRIYYVYDASESELYRILEKHFKIFQKENFEQELYQEELRLFTSALNISNSELDVLQKNTIRYAYMRNMPYEVYGSSQFDGILGQYVSRFSQFSGVDFKYVQYHNNKSLERDLNSNKIQLLSTFSGTVQGGSVVSTNFPMVAAVMVHDSNPVLIESLESLKSQVVYVEENSSLVPLLGNFAKEIKTFKMSELSKIMKNKENIFVLDEQVVQYLIKNSYNDYHVAYTINLNATYGFRSYGSDVFNKLMIKYFNYLDPHMAEVQGQYYGHQLEKKSSFFASVARYALYAIFVTIVVLIIIYRSSKKVRLQKKIKKEDKLKFVDHLTSLKNRNYLNENLEIWNKNTIYPQAVIVIDLNRVRLINDTYGYEEGDKQIVSAASVLIKTQLDNTDIIRTDGNEFMVYLVGYTTKQVTSYIHKLTKEFKALPYENGVCISYSMIESDTKSIEDALNECVEDIKKQKEEEK